ncbi:MAG: AbrB/MazE/SpoVT family DNA-binding domain-containing protein [Candidatus Thorarchaeota archaeon]
MGTSQVDKRGRVTIPREIREKAGLKPGDRVRVLSENNRVIVERLVDFETFRRELRGCITTPGEPDPMELKKIWSFQ